MMQPKDILTFVEADTKEKLVEQCAKINHKLGWHKYFSIQEQLNGRWVAWYYEDIEKLSRKKLNDVTNDNTRP